MRTLFCALVLSSPLPLLAQSDTVRLNPGLVALDGTKYHDHFLATTVNRTHGDTTLSHVEYAIDVRHETGSSGRVVHVTIGPLAGRPDPGVRVTTLLDSRTTAPLHYEVQITNGGTLSVDFHGAHVTGQRRAGADSAVVPVDVTLAEPAFLGAYEDAALDAVHLHTGMVLRVPVISLSPAGVGTVQPYFYRVTRRDTVRANGHDLPTWVVESRDSVNTNTIWLIDEPPYTYRWLRVSARGRVTDLEQVVRPVGP